MDAVIQSIRPYENIRMVVAIQKDSGMVIAIQSKSHVCNHKPIRATRTYVTLVQGLESNPIKVQFLTCKYHVLKLGILENHLITD